MDDTHVTHRPMSRVWADVFGPASRPIEMHGLHPRELMALPSAYCGYNPKVSADLRERLHRVLPDGDVRDREPRDVETIGSLPYGFLHVGGSYEAELDRMAREIVSRVGAHACLNDVNVSLVDNVVTKAHMMVAHVSVNQK